MYKEYKKLEQAPAEAKYKTRYINVSRKESKTSRHVKLVTVLFLNTEYVLLGAIR